MKPQVLCIPGSVAPAAQRYRPLIEGVGDAADLHLKELEVYREATPPPGYSIEEELDAIDRVAESKGLRHFHLVGYSGGGFISLAYAGTRPERVISLALFEPARIPGKLSAEEQAMYDSLEAKLRGLQGAEFMATFIREQLKPGVAMPPPPPPGPPSPEMQKRPAGIAALIQAFQAFQFDRTRFTEVRFPVFLGYGDQTHEFEQLEAGVLAWLFSDIHVRRYAGIHHFVPPEMIYTSEHVGTLLDLWQRAETSAGELSRK
jgi:pimeloyl-ACP methyl ester carboxylesterase